MSPDLSCNLKLAILTDLKRLDAAADVIRTDVLREENKSRNLRISREVFSVLGDAVKSARDVVLRDTFFRVSNFYCKIFLSFWHVFRQGNYYLLDQWVLEKPAAVKAFLTVNLISKVYPVAIIGFKAQSIRVKKSP